MSSRDVQVIFAHAPFKYLNFECFARLAYQLPHPQRYVSRHASVKNEGAVYRPPDLGDEICPPKGGGFNLAHGNKTSIVDHLKDEGLPK